MDRDLLLRMIARPFFASFAFFAGCEYGGVDKGWGPTHTDPFSNSIYLSLYSLAGWATAHPATQAPPASRAKEAKKAKEPRHPESLRRSSPDNDRREAAQEVAKEVRTIPSMPDLSPAPDNPERYYQPL